MTTQERIANLKQFGYTDREAQFLCLAALHSGYFVRRQFLFFIGKNSGQLDENFLARAAANSHTKTSIFRSDRVLYHLASKPLYEAIGEGDNRNRRDHQVFAVKRRLMALDFVLQHRTNEFLATETEKVACFCEDLGIDKSYLPVKRYRSETTRLATERYFVDKFPISVSSASPEAPPVVHFCYVDEGLHSTSGFERYLQEYRLLFARLTRVHLIYIACSQDQFAKVRRVFQRMVLKPDGRVPVDPRVRHMLSYFRHRAAYELRNFSGFTQEKLIRFREDREAFSSENHERFFQTWKDGGDAAVLSELCPEAVSSSQRVREFGTYLLRFNYELFGTLMNGNGKEKACVAR